MSVANTHKAKRRLRSELVREDYDEGTAARTRPFSFDDIMNKRKKKKESFDVSQDALDKDVKRTSDNPEYERSPKTYSNDLPAGVKTISKDVKMVSDRKKDYDKHIIEEKTMKIKEEKRHVSRTRSKTTTTKNFDEKVRGGQDDHKGYVRINREEMSPVHEEYESEKRTRDVKHKDKLADISRGLTERERSKISSVIKRDLDRPASELSERKERKDSVELQKKESRPKRRRSRSRERDKGKSRSSTSFSVRAHKHSTREHGDTHSHNSRKDRSEKQVSDLDGNRISSNGSSSHNNRHGGSTSGLGGYSPRKRRTEAAVKTPSPTHLSPDKRSVGWDLPPPVTITSNIGSLPIDMQPSDQVVASDIVVSIPSPAVKVITGIFSNASIDSIQLTQATRPMRRLYVENLPASASEKSIRECFNNFLLGSGVNHIKGTQPCISCIVNKEKSQAIVEFLTPEDASAALAFDGRSFFGSFLKVRRPKDFIEVTTGISEKPIDAVDSISDTVKDSPYKIFIGGIPNAISSEMLMEIAGVFGPLKAYRFEINTELKASFAFLEYVDQSVTLKACAALNGMKMGGQMLTAVQARPDASLLEDDGTPPFYGIPGHAKPLLEKPTCVLKLWNMIDPECLSSLSEAEVDGLLEDIRLECSRSGAVKSVNIVWNSEGPKTALDNLCSSGNEQDLSNFEKESPTKECTDSEFSKEIKTKDAVDESDDADKIVDGNHIDDAAVAAASSGDNLPLTETLTPKESLEMVSMEQLDQVGTSLCAIRKDVLPIVKYELESECGLSGDMFEPGSVLVEYRREEAACMAAHYLHGRFFDGRIVNAAYVPFDVYRARYSK
ncbi:splicing factor U2af large subunit A [Impatiens glandulifera]|uniref:splicing factor U2af large subunit A n=1 Tax=Impatiens glandulifera TaxID=253017 RepID=UPI001FB0BD11|nr:splicing factor U2af large subunit A [Impatiens glandulifera]